MIFKKFLKYLFIWLIIGAVLLCSPSWFELKILLTWTPRSWDWQVHTATPNVIKVSLKVTETFLSSLATIQKPQRNVLCAQHSDGKFPLLRKLKSSFDVTDLWSNCSLRYFIVYVTDPKKEGSSLCRRARKKSQDQTFQYKEHQLEPRRGKAGVIGTLQEFHLHTCIHPSIRHLPFHLLTAKRIYQVEPKPPVLKPF